jgi:MATE family multidrug resistance protein
MSLHREILRLALPNIVANVAIPVLGVFELGITGHLGSEVYIGAIGVGAMIFNFVFWAFAFLRMSMSGLTAQAYGRNDQKDILLLLLRGSILGLGIGFILIALQKPIGIAIFSVLKASPEVEQFAAQYFYIRIWSAPAALGLYAVTGWFIGMQNAKSPMWIAIVSSVIALLLNVLFVYGLGMKSDGIALGTTLSQYVGLLMAVVIMLRKYPFIFQFKPKYKELTRSLGLFFKVNSDIFVRMLCVIFVFSFFTLRSANTNDYVLAVNTILIQFLFFFSFFIDGFAYAGEALIGRFTGANDLIMLRKSIKGLFVWAFIIVVPFMVIYLFFSPQILGLITNDKLVVAASQPYIKWVKLIPILCFMAYIWDGVYIGAAASKAMRNTMLISTVMVFVPVYCIMNQYIGNHALWLALLLFMLSRGVLQTVLAGKVLNIKQDKH